MRRLMAHPQELMWNRREAEVLHCYDPLSDDNRFTIVALNDEIQSKLIVSIQIRSLDNAHFPQNVPMTDKELK